MSLYCLMDGTSLARPYFRLPALGLCPPSPPRKIALEDRLPPSLTSPPSYGLFASPPRSHFVHNDATSGTGQSTTQLQELGGRIDGITISETTLMPRDCPR